MKFIELETERLVLRKFRKSDFPIAYDWLGNPENMKYRRSILNEEETHTYLEWAISNANEEDCINFEYAAILKETGALIGAASLFNLDTEPELGWTLHRNYWHQGYGTEMGRALLKFGFESLGLRRIIAGCITKNTASYRIMEKLGMRREAHFIKVQRGNNEFKNEWFDRYQYAILYDEWSIEKPANSNITSIGVDGCKGGWIAAKWMEGHLTIDKFPKVSDIVETYPDFDEFFIDMVIGMQSEHNHVRPDTYARQIIKERASTIFPAPCRQAVYAKTVSEAYIENERVLGKKFTPLTVGIIPKIRELDTFLQNNPQYKNVIKESHPEVCFARLNGRTLLSKKSDIEGMEERIKLLAKYIPELTLNKLSAMARDMKCNIDDIVDAVCLTVAANIAAQGCFDIIPEHPMKDETDLLMQMVIPRLN